MKKRFFRGILLTLASLSIATCSLVAQNPANAIRPKVKVWRLDANVNSPYEELAPVVSGNGQKLFFVRGQHPDNVGGIEAGQDVWMSTRVNDSTWTRAINLGWPINNEGHNVVCGTNYEGNLLYLCNRYNPADSLKDPKPKIKMSPGISVSFYNPNKLSWSYPRAIGLEGMEHLSRNSHFYFHWVDSTHRQLLVSKHSTLDNREEDIYLYELDPATSSYKLRTDLGPAINTEMYETAPFLSANKKKLYFTRHVPKAHFGGQYGADAHIYVAERPDTSAWTNWDTPKLLYENFEALRSDVFQGLNSEHFDAYLYLLDGIYKPRQGEAFEVLSYGFFTSARPSAASAAGVSPQAPKADIYEFTLLDVSYKLVIRTFSVTNADTTALPARVILESPVYTRDSGTVEKHEWAYELKADELGELTLRAGQTGYTKEVLTFDIGPGDYLVEKDVYLQRIYTTRMDTLAGINFAYGSNAIQPRDQINL
ncbi:MAG: hypothetical protein HC880_19410, partial [Bacteroidia bacterium]|nr:hypothetical protein [Bacteroidia bacterium]